MHNKLFLISLTFLIAGCDGACLEVGDDSKLELTGTVVGYMEYELNDGRQEYAVMELDGDVCFKKAKNSKNVLLAPYGPNDFELGYKSEYRGEVYWIEPSSINGPNELNTELLINFGSWREVN